MEKVVIAMLLGISVGYMLNPAGPFSIDGKAFLKEYLLPFGNTFIALIKMVVVPLIFFSLISGVTSMTDAGAFKRVGLKAVVAFLCTASFAVLIGLVFGAVFQPGKDVNLDQLARITDTPGAAAMHGDGIPAGENFNLAKLLSDIVPENILHAMSGNDHILQVVVFAIFAAITMNALGEKARIVKEFCQSGAQLMFKMIDSIMKLSPYGVFAIMASLVSAQGLRILGDLAVLTAAVTCALFLQYLLFGLMIIVFARMSPLPFYRKMLEVQSFAFSTSSSKATLPTAMRVVHENIGVSESSATFVLPLGAAINMDGTAIYLGICALFFAQAYGIHFSVHQYGLLVLTATLGSIGAAGIPGGSILMMGMVFSSVGLPLSAIGVILGIDRILDMLRTTVNITGDSVITLLIDKSEGTFREDVYYDKS